MRSLTYVFEKKIIGAIAQLKNNALCVFLNESVTVVTDPRPHDALLRVFVGLSVRDVSQDPRTQSRLD